MYYFILLQVIWPGSCNYQNLVPYLESENFEHLDFCRNINLLKNCYQAAFSMVNDEGGDSLIYFSNCFFRPLFCVSDDCVFHSFMKNENSFVPNISCELHSLNTTLF